MVVIVDKCGLQEVWVEESKTTPTFEEVLRLLAMYEFPADKTTVYPVDAIFVIEGRLDFDLAKLATHRAMIVWRDNASHALFDAYYADWLDAKLIVIQTK